MTIVDKKTLFMGEEEFEYIVEESNGKYYGKTVLTPKLNVEAQSLDEIYRIVVSRISQLTHAS